MGKGSTGPSPAVQQGLLSNETALTGIAEQQNTNAQQLYQASFPGFQSAEQFYGALSTGDPYAIARAISPATQQITEQADAAKANILRNSPAGGEKNLALEQVDVNRGAAVGGTATNAFLGSYNALAQLAGQGINENISSAGVGVSGLSAGSQSLQGLGQLQLEGQEIQAQQKGSTLGAFSSLAGSGAELGSAGKIAGGGGGAAAGGAGAAAGKGGGAVAGDVGKAALAAA
jgi:hypothetical protein